MKINKKILYTIILLMVIYIFETIRQNYNIYKENDKIVSILKTNEISKNEITTYNKRFYVDYENYGDIFYLMKSKKTNYKFTNIFNKEYLPKIILIKDTIYKVDKVLKRHNDEVDFTALKKDIVFSYDNLGDYEYNKSKVENSNFLNEIAYYMVEDFLYTEGIDKEEYDIILLNVKNEKISFYGLYVRNDDKWGVELEEGIFKNMIVNIDKKYYSTEEYSREYEKGTLKRYDFSNKKALYLTPIKEEIVYQSVFSRIPKKEYLYYQDKEVYLNTYNEFGTSMDFKKIR